MVSQIKLALYLFAFIIAASHAARPVFLHDYLYKYKSHDGLLQIF